MEQFWCIFIFIIVQVVEMFPRGRQWSLYLSRRQGFILSFVFNTMAADNLVAQVMVMTPWYSVGTSKRKRSHFDEIIVTGYPGSCHFVNFRWSQWRKFRLSDNIPMTKQQNSKPWTLIMSVIYLLGKYNETSGESMGPIGHLVPWGPEILRTHWLPVAWEPFHKGYMGS